MSVKATYNEKRLVFSCIDFSNSRKLMKLKIFFNSQKDFTYTIEGNSLYVDFNINDENVISNDITKTVSMIENLYGEKVSFDENLSRKIDDNQNKKISFYDSINLLKKLKQNENNEEDFNKFCNFCDSTLSCKLRPYQYKAAYYLTIGNGGFDFSVPGSGKTIISYAAYNYLKDKKICDSVLIIGPINSYNAWHDEYYTCFQEEPDFYSLANLSKNDSLIYLMSSRPNHKEITFINIDKAWRFKNEIISFMSNKKILLIIDEAHKEKNPSAEITKAVLEITKYCNVRIILTGTPMPNGYEDLFSLTKIYEPYEKVLPYGYSDLKRLTKNGATLDQQKKLMESIRPIFSRVSKKFLLETGELLEPNVTIVKCHLSNEQNEIYDFLNKYSFEIDNDLESSLNISLMKAVLIRKMQTSANPGLLSKSIVSSIEEYKKEYFDEFDKDDSNNDLLIKADKKLKQDLASSTIAKIVGRFENNFLTTPKNETAVSLALQIVSNGEKVILWDVFVQNMDTLKNMLSKKYSGKIEIINGTVSGEDRQVAINNFKNGNSMVMIANPATLAESISLHKCCQNAIYVNRNYNAAQFIQSKDRIHRINMPKGKTANYFFLINEDTVDEEVNERLKLKENRMLRILDSDDLEIGGSEFENDAFMNLDDILASYKK